MQVPGLPELWQTSWSAKNISLSERACTCSFGSLSESGELWIALDRAGTGIPWSGQSPPALSGPPRLWPPATESHSPGLRAEVAGLIPLSEELEKTAHHHHHHDASETWSQLAEGLLSSRMLFWLIMMAVLAYYLFTARPAWFVNLMQELGGLLERQSQKFVTGREFAVSEMG
eukprot:s2388_g1.t1